MSVDRRFELPHKSASTGAIDRSMTLASGLTGSVFERKATGQPGGDGLTQHYLFLLVVGYFCDRGPCAQPMHPRQIDGGACCGSPLERGIGLRWQFGSFCIGKECRLP